MGVKSAGNWAQKQETIRDCTTPYLETIEGISSTAPVDDATRLRMCAARRTGHCARLVDQGKFGSRASAMYATARLRYYDSQV